LHRLAASFVLGFHGCDREVGEGLLAGKPFRVSQNEYDWLGEGVYFWEANPGRGLSFAEEKRDREGTRSSIRRPFVIGAIIDLGLCLDLTTSAGADLVRSGYRELKVTMDAAGQPLPKNSARFPLRKLDCAVINFTHHLRAKAGEPPIQTVRGVFIEGDPAYPGASFHEKTHIQIAVCDNECIKGVFRVRDAFIGQG
jgi:hypothetical protein